MFEIRLDDIYICHDDTSGYVIMADMSKIFKMKLSKQINSDNVSYKYVKNKLRKNKFLPINYVRVFMEFAAIAGHYTPVQDIMQNCFLDKTCAKPCILSYGDCIDTNSPFKEKGNQILIMKNIIQKKNCLVLFLLTVNKTNALIGKR